MVYSDKKQIELNSVQWKARCTSKSLGAGLVSGSGGYGGQLNNMQDKYCYTSVTSIINMQAQAYYANPKDLLANIRKNAGVITTTELEPISSLYDS